jgi:hypothetical protein
MKAISKALLKAQGEFLPIEKNTNAFKYKYAPLDHVLDCIRPALTKHGILITQPSEIQDGTPVQRTVLFHIESGESIISSMELQCTTGAQDRGSEVTYLRRYTLMSSAGIFPVNEDDDGKAAQDSSPKDKKAKRAKPEPKEESTENTDSGVVEVYKAFLEDCNNMDDLKEFWKSNQAELKKLEKSQPAIYKSVFGLFSLKKKDLTTKGS